MFEYMIMPFRRYAEFSGRSRRLEYWGFTLLNVIVILLIMAVAMAFGFSFTALSSIEKGADPSLALGSGFYLLMGLIAVYGLAIIIPSVAVTVRRLHDRDMSGWWYLGFIVLGAIPFVGWIANIAFLVILCLPGTAGPNRFGEDPLDPTGAEVFA